LRGTCECSIYVIGRLGCRLHEVIFAERTMPINETNTKNVTPWLPLGNLQKKTVMFFVVK